MLRREHVLRIVVWTVVILVIMIASPPKSCVNVPEGDPPPVLTVLTYNIHHGEGVDGRFDLERLAAVIRAADPDLAALQEVDRATGRSGGVDQAAELGRLTGMYVHFAAAMPFDGGEYGEAVLSRTPFLERRVIPLPAGPGYEPRAGAFARVAPLGDDRGVVFVGTHLDHTDDPANRVAQARALVAALADEAAPVIVAGDLNDVPGSEMHAVFAGWADFGRDLGPTFPSASPEVRIDYVLAREPAAWRRAEASVVDEPVASDHAPIRVRLVRR